MRRNCQKEKPFRIQPQTNQKTKTKLTQLGPFSSFLMLLVLPHSKILPKKTNDSFKVFLSGNKNSTVRARHELVCYPNNKREFGSVLPKLSMQNGD